jgi:photosystem II stability/assembly factor-like uncharacterized protein
LAVIEMRTWKVAAITVATTVALSCSTTSSESGFEPPGMVHIHGLGINPSDETLYSATHYGLFRVNAEGEPQRVGELIQDFMGFTVIGSDHFLASGHPGADSRQQPPHLGLIESTDGGQSWNVLSLKGEADFHALEYRHDRVYGHDSQSERILVSTDKRTWDERGVIRAIDLSVSPRNPDEMLATTKEGLQRSLNGGATFDAVPGAPPLAYVSWPYAGTLIGVGPQGTIYSSDDKGDTWRSLHALNQAPQALLAADNGRVFIATDTTIYESSDNATTVEPLTVLN